MISVSGISYLVLNLPPLVLHVIGLCSRDLFSSPGTCYALTRVLLHPVSTSTLCNFLGGLPVVSLTNTEISVVKSVGLVSYILRSFLLRGVFMWHFAFIL